MTFNTRRVLLPARFQIHSRHFSNRISFIEKSLFFFSFQSPWPMFLFCHFAFRSHEKKKCDDWFYCVSNSSTLNRWACVCVSKWFESKRFLQLRKKSQRMTQKYNRQAQRKWIPLNYYIRRKSSLSHAWTHASQYLIDESNVERLPKQRIRLFPLSSSPPYESTVHRTHYQFNWTWLFFLLNYDNRNSNILFEIDFRNEVGSGKHFFHERKKEKK